ncbi:Allergen Asp f 7 [Vanrija pseudolonga]|uniref:Allergen Asp f 7 n=1 Tax=Vanrija pseudolonga TaxID=143232 RepID=A0AAF0Y5X7_9TREE|nr:Allergen Asp f 7 [Vanrija pseudolonga]
MKLAVALPLLLSLAVAAPVPGWWQGGEHHDGTLTLTGNWPREHHRHHGHHHHGAGSVAPTDGATTDVAAEPTQVNPGTPTTPTGAPDDEGNEDPDIPDCEDGETAADAVTIATDAVTIATDAVPMPLATQVTTADNGPATVDTAVPASPTKGHKHGGSSEAPVTPDQVTPGPNEAAQAAAGPAAPVLQASPDAASSPAQAVTPTPTPSAKKSKAKPSEAVPTPDAASSPDAAPTDSITDPGTSSTPEPTPTKKPKASPSPAADSGSNNSGGGGGGGGGSTQFSGLATFWDVNNPADNGGFAAGVVACEGVSTSGYIVALKDGWDNGIHCGKQVVITDPTTGNTEYATVADKCSSCRPGGLDLSPSLWNKLANDQTDIGQFNANWGFV